MNTPDTFSRTRLLLGSDAITTLSNRHIIIFGLGGAGSYAAEALTRGGIGSLTFVDYDKVAQDNINRQLIATLGTLGERKAEVAKKRAQEINPRAKITAICDFYTPLNGEALITPQYDYILDATDSIIAKIDIVHRAAQSGVPLISCMGTGNRVDPTKLRIGDITAADRCPVARVMRKELSQHGITSLKVVYSDEPPLHTDSSAVGSVPCVPAVAGLLMASEAMRDLLRAATAIPQASTL